MTQLANAETHDPVVSQLDRGYVDWAAVIGGALVAVAILTTLTAFGSAVGLSLTSAQPGHGI